VLILEPKATRRAKDRARENIGDLVPDDPVPMAVLDKPEVLGEVHDSILAAFGLPALLSP